MSDQDAEDAAAFDRGFMAEHRRATSMLTPEFPAFPPGIEGIPHKSHYVVSDFIFCHEHGKFCGAPANVCTRGHVHDTPKEAVACDRLDLLTESRAERAYRLGLDTENAPDSTV